MLEPGSVIPASRAATPVPVEDLVVSLDDFVRSVPLDSLRTVVDELGTAFDGTARPLQQILDGTDAFTDRRRRRAAADPHADPRRADRADDAERRVRLVPGASAAT